MDTISLRLHSSIPEEMIDRFYEAGLLALLHPPIPFPCIFTQWIMNHRQHYSCGDSVGFTPNFPIKLHIVVPPQNLHNILFLITMVSVPYTNNRVNL